MHIAKYGSELLPNCLKQQLIICINGDSVIAKGKIVLLINVGLTMIMIKFLVVNLSSPYNMILKQTWIHQMQIVYVLITKKILFPTMQRVMKIIRE